MLRITIPLVLIIIVTAIWLSNKESTDANSGFQIGELLGGIADDGFARATKPRSFIFPKDHGPHPEFRNEWWYFTGNLFTKDKRRFGFQIVFFRNAITPENINRVSEWSSNQTWMAHLALTDVSGKEFYAYERFSRGGKGLAGAIASPFNVWIYDWSIQASSDAWKLHSKDGDIELNLDLKPLVQPLLQGKDGLSQKSSKPGNASYYYSIPRLSTHGSIKIKDKQYQVEGLSWLDREWSTSALGKDQVGWDWFSLQLSDGSDLMFYRLRRKDGSADPHSSGTLLRKNGEILRLNKEDVLLEELDWWQSPQGGRYPISWKLEIPKQNIKLKVKPVMENQELDLLIRYWEGAVDVVGKSSGKIIKGHGYLELAGYADQARSN